MLPRDDRLRPASRVRATIRNGRRVRSGSLVVHYLADNTSPHAAVVVGRPIGGAVQRHRRQRQVRHALAEVWDRLPGGSYVVRAMPHAATYAQLRTDLDRVISRL